MAKFSLNDNTVIFAICLMLSIVIWVINKFSSDLTYSDTFTVNYVLPEDLLIENRVPDKVNAEISGRGWDILGFNKSYGDTLDLVLSSEPLQVFSDEFLKARINTKLTGENLEVEEIDRDLLTVKLEEKIRKELPVKISSYIINENFVILDSLILDPSTVEVSGPVSYLNEADTIYLTGFTLPETTGEFKIEVPVPTRHKFAYATPRNVAISGNVDLLTEIKINAPVTIDSALSEKYQVEPQNVQLSVKIPSSFRKEVHFSQFTVTPEFIPEMFVGEKRNVLLKVSEQPPYVKRSPLIVPQKVALTRTN